MWSEFVCNSEEYEFFLTFRSVAIPRGSGGQHVARATRASGIGTFGTSDPRGGRWHSRDPLADEATVKRLLFERIELMRRMQNRTLSEQ